MEILNKVFPACVIAGAYSRCCLAAVLPTRCRRRRETARNAGENRANLRFEPGKCGGNPHSSPVEPQNRGGNHTRRGYEPEKPDENRAHRRCDPQKRGECRATATAGSYPGAVLARFCRITRKNCLVDFVSSRPHVCAGRLSFISSRSHVCPF